MLLPPSVAAATSSPISGLSPLRLEPVTYDLTRQAHRALLRRRKSGESVQTKQLIADSSTLTAYLTDLNLHDFEPLLVRLPAGYFEGATGPPVPSRDLRRFLVEWARAASSNKALLRMIADCRSSLERPSDEEVHRLVHYCLCLHLITRELAASPTLAKKVLDHQQSALRSMSDWWKYLSAFEHAKLITLERALVFFGYHRAPEAANEHQPIPANFGRVGLPFNILEAVNEIKEIQEDKIKLKNIKCQVELKGFRDNKLKIKTDQKRLQ